MSQNMSFLPEDYLEKRIIRRTNWICLSLFVIVVTAVVVTFFFTDKQVDSLLRQQLMVNKKFVEAAANLEKLEKLQKQKTEMIRKAKVTFVLVEKIPRSRLLAELTNSMPRSMSLISLDLNTKKVIKHKIKRTSLEQAKQQAFTKQNREMCLPETNVQVAMVGLAPTDVEVAQFLTVLSAHEMFINSELQFSEETCVEDVKMRRFRIITTLNQDLNLKDIELKKINRELNNNPMDQNLNITSSGVNSNVSSTNENLTIHRYIKGKK